MKDKSAIIDHKLYWSLLEDESEAYYLMSILNSEAARKRIERLQSRGLWGARDFDKVMFTLPIPRYSDTVKLHRDLAAAGREAEVKAAAVELPQAAAFARARKAVRDALRADGVSGRIDGLVDRLLDGD